MTTIETEPLQCMEVWGGNCAVDRSFETAGLKIWAYSRPFEFGQSGGDVYYLSACASGRITRMLLADVSGHGEHVAAVASDLRDLMRRNINTIKQTRFVSEMNRQFSSTNDGQNFATALVTTFFAPTKTLELCNAGHPPPMVYRHDTDCWREVSEESTIDSASPPDQIADIPLGIADETAYGKTNLVLEPGDMVLLFSDSVTESIRADGTQIGAAGVLKLVSQWNGIDPADLIPMLIDHLTEMHADNLQQDDTTILLAQATGTGATMRNNVLAPLRLLFSPHDNIEMREE